MPALFPPWSNTAFRVALVALLLFGTAAVSAPMLYVRTDYASQENMPVPQPVEFDHRHHVRDGGIPCLYCHYLAETSSTAGMPSTDVCMGCHAQIWNQSPLLAPVRQSYFTGVPISWNRVYRVPDFTYFHHGIHVQNGVDCTSCHGRVDGMARVFLVTPLTMGWCVDCHRARGDQPHRPPDASMAPDASMGLHGTVFESDLDPDPSPLPISRQVTCSACHR
jgi:hypothetical protein